jgi:hypothetical protein
MNHAIGRDVEGIGCVILTAGILSFGGSEVTSKLRRIGGVGAATWIREL